MQFEAELGATQCAVVSRYVGTKSYRAGICPARHRVETKDQRDSDGVQSEAWSTGLCEQML